MNNIITIARLSAAMRAVCPDAEVSVGVIGNPSTVTFRSSASQAQRDAAQAVITGFDWSAAADAAWQLTQDRANALTSFLTDKSPAAKVLRAVAEVLLDQVNVLEQQLQTLRDATRVVAPSIPAITYPQYTITDLTNAVQAKINSGAAD